MSSVKEMKYIHYALCCFSSAFVRQDQPKVAVEATSQNAPLNPAVNSAQISGTDKQTTSQKVSLQTDRGPVSRPTGDGSLNFYESGKMNNLDKNDAQKPSVMKNKGELYPE